MLYEMVTGAAPFEGNNPYAIMNARLIGDPVAPRKRNPEISPQVEEIILHALERQPYDRYPTAAAMKAELDGPGRACSLTGPLRAAAAAKALAQTAGAGSLCLALAVGPRGRLPCLPAGPASPVRCPRRDGTPDQKRLVTVKSG